MSSSRAMQRLCGLMRKAVQDYEICLLYTSDAADEL